MKTFRNLRFFNLIVWINIKLQIPRDHRTPLPIPSLIHRASHKIFAFPRSAFHHTKALSQSTPMAYSPPCICFDWYKNIDSGIASSNTSILFEYQSNTDFEAFFAELRQSGSQVGGGKSEKICMKFESISIGIVSIMKLSYFRRRQVLALPTGLLR